MGGGLKRNKIFMMSFGNPGFDTMAMAVYTFGNCAEAKSLVALSGTGELLR